MTHLRTRVQLREIRCDDTAPVASLCEVLVEPEALHEVVEHHADVSGSKPRPGGALGEPVPGQRGRDHLKHKVLPGPRCGQQGDQLVELSY